MAPKAVRYATYPGDCTHIVGEVKCPNTFGELLTAVEATFDPSTGSTRVGFAYGVPDTEVLAGQVVD